MDDDAQFLRSEFLRLAGHIEDVAKGKLAMREGVVSAQLAARLLAKAIHDGVVKAPARIKQLLIELEKETAASPSQALDLTHPAVRFFHLAVDGWLSKVKSYPIRVEPGGLSRFNNVGASPNVTAEIVRGRLWTAAGACRVLGELARMTDEAKPNAPLREPLTDNERFVLSIIRRQKLGEGIQSKQILKQLDEDGLTIDDTDLRKRIIPRLKRDYNVKNRRGVGYYCDRDSDPT